jgi:Lysozyme like domain
MSDTSNSNSTTTTTTTTAPVIATGTGANLSGNGGALTSDQVIGYWIQAGGNPQAAQMAEAIADASSGLNPNTKITNPDGSIVVGLWLIPQNGSPPGSTDPLANARAAVQLSNNGTNWSQWCTAWSDNDCGLNGGTYLGEGSNALGALGDFGAYNVIGASPTGTGTSASTTPTTGTSTSTSIISSSWFKWGLLAAIVAVIYMFAKGKGNTSGSGSGSEGSAWTQDQINALSSNETDAELAERLGRSRHAIHVKRSRLKEDYTH